MFDCYRQTSAELSIFFSVVWGSSGLITRGIAKKKRGPETERKSHKKKNKIRTHAYALNRILYAQVNDECGERDFLRPWEWLGCVSVYFLPPLSSLNFFRHTTKMDTSSFYLSLFDLSHFIFFRDSSLCSPTMTSKLKKNRT